MTPTAIAAQAVNDAAILAAHCERANARVARLIHDGPAQKLTAAVIAVSLLKSDLEEGKSLSPEAFKELNELLQTVSTEMREVTLQLRPRALDLFGISAALESIASKRGHFRCRHPANTIEMDAEAAIQLIRITEAVLSAIESETELETDFYHEGPFATLRIRNVASITIQPEALARARVFGGTINHSSGVLVIRLLRSRA